MLMVLMALLLVGAVLYLILRQRRHAKNIPPSLSLLLRERRVLTREEILAAVHRAFEKDLANPAEKATNSVEVGEVGWSFQTEGYSLGGITLPGTVVPDPERLARELLPVVGSAPADGEGLSPGPERAAEANLEARVRTAFAGHRGEIMLLCQKRPSGATRADAYVRLGKLAAELVDENTLLVYCPEEKAFIHVNGESVEELRSGYVLKTPSMVVSDSVKPVADIPSDDASLAAAMAEARRRLPEFVAAWSAAEDRSMFSVKGPFTDGTHTEFMWLSATAIEGETLRGRLASKPFRVRGLREGSEVSVAFAEVSDWCYPDGSRPVGLFTEAIVQKAL